MVIDSLAFEFENLLLSFLLAISMSKLYSLIRLKQTNSLEKDSAIPDVDIGKESSPLMSLRTFLSYMSYGLPWRLSR